MKQKVCPECGSEDVSSDVDVNYELDDYPRVVREYDFCYRCGHKWNIQERKESKKL